MKRLLFLLLLVFVSSLLLLTLGCDAPGEVSNDQEEEVSPDEAAEPAPAPAPAAGEQNFENGTYRGAFIDRDAVQVNIQFSLEDNIVTSIGYRHLGHRGINYLEPDTEATAAILDQHEQILEHLEGKDVREHLADLFEPGNFVEDVDGFSGATIRANKVISAIRDGLNRGVYVY